MKGQGDDERRNVKSNAIIWSNCLGTILGIVKNNMWTLYGFMLQSIDIQTLVCSVEAYSMLHLNMSYMSGTTLCLAPT